MNMLTCATQAIKKKQPRRDSLISFPAKPAKVVSLEMPSSSGENSHQAKIKGNLSIV